MTTPARVPVRSGSNARRVPRCPLAVPVRITLRGPQGPCTLPGRSLELGEGGLSAILAGKVRPGDTVAVEFLLPELGLGLHTKAVVRHHADLRCGVEFFGLSLEQQAMIRRWTRRMLEKPAAPRPAASVAVIAPAPRKRRHRWLLRSLAVAALLVAVGGLVAWRFWHADWVELRQRVDAPAQTAMQRIKLPPGVMEPRIVHKEEAVYPSGATNGVGIVLLHIVVGADGTVIDADPVSGDDALARSAMDAVKEWRFQPFRFEGAPAEVDTTVAVSFRESPSQ